MTYDNDECFDDPRKIIDFFLRDDQFRTSDKYEASSTGKGTFIFRGQSNAKWELLASAFRKGSLKNFTPQPPSDDFDAANILRHLGLHLHAEANAIFRFMESADSMGIPTPLDYTTTKHGMEVVMAAFNNKKDCDYSQPFPTEDFQRATALAQHHGVPTRFLDWTESPLVACYFAAMGASSFSAEPPVDGQELSVVFLSAFTLSKEASPVEIIKAPRHENSNLLQQQGIFTNIKHANTFFIEKKRWPVLDEFSPGNFQLNRVRLPAERADDLLRELFDLKITRHSMMPSLTTAAKAYEYVHVLFSDVT